jgi:hypothetical protein
LVVEALKGNFAPRRKERKGKPEIIGFKEGEGQRMEKEHLEILLEDIRGKFDLVLEGHEVLRKEIREVRDESNAKHEQTAFLLKALNDKVDGVENRLSAKIDAVAGDLAAHRKDTEAHGAVWRVKEEGE